MLQQEQSVKNMVFPIVRPKFAERIIGNFHGFFKHIFNDLPTSCNFLIDTEDDWWNSDFTYCKCLFFN